MPKQLPSIGTFNRSDAKRINQTVDDLTARIDRGAISKVAKIQQRQMHQNEVKNRRLPAGQLISIRHQLGVIPSNVQFTPLAGGTIEIVRMTKDRIYVRAIPPDGATNVEANVTIRA